MAFRFNLHDTIELGISGERGYIKGRAEYLTSGPSYYIHYKSADGRAVTDWFNEEDLERVEDAEEAICVGCSKAL